MAVQEQHDLADYLLLGPARADPQRTLGPDAGDFLETFGRLLDGVEYGRTERLHQLSGIDRADALDHAVAGRPAAAAARGPRRSRLTRPRAGLRRHTVNRSAKWA